MCGIFAAISTSSADHLSDHLRQCLCSRGPDHLGAVQAKVCRDGDVSHHLQFISTVLSLRGDHVARQPLRDDATGSVLCWNGEAWKLGEDLVTGNDSEVVMSALLSASRAQPPNSIDNDGALDVLRSIDGPFAFVFFDRPSQRLYYGRDRLGRRSLLFKPGSPFLLCSVADVPTPGWIEVEADGCYVIELGRNDQLTEMIPTRHSWAKDETFISGIGLFNDAVPDDPCFYKDREPVDALRSHLVESLCPRLLDVPLPPCASQTDARVAVLFSGGLDCTVLARLASDILPADQHIDLINVAFENPRIAQQHKSLQPAELYELCPDRVTGRKSFVELLHVCPQRAWRFVTINVPFALTCEKRPEIVQLMHPHNTEMDLSIACALYFAARGRGTSTSSPDSVSQSYDTTARVLVSGLGADELFGGYSRHGAAFSRAGYASLIDELKLDVARLGRRNLGRDDRVMAHWGREVRFPFLDEAFVKWAIGLSVWDKCGFGRPDHPSGVDPEKRVLRLLATGLGLEGVALEKKRAIQFGARTAKMESGKVKGTTVLSA